ncbi:hypothetical protein CXG81DRAFT_9533 [Caulochytrium protostelioides]|uniref:Synaptobrevin homolog YKT6 n=1 Tax=Caulochytrium protostelioides TaxID=1555241 RepID=A0A4P9XE26_9FUNG|nr:hypothetical protein CXG81DRAFT_9533 [Caulochytrium protostelioides]|eukprot:RKP03391.1 hypothetical protein CXG81DRAFT_9533 [Caulochytrium protostelioides]
MKVFTLAIAQQGGKPINVLASAFELSTFGYFQRGSIEEFMNFFVATVTERTAAGVRQTIEENNFVGHVMARNDGLTGVMVTDAEYPTRAAFSLLNRVLDEFCQKCPRTTWSQLKAANTATHYPELKAHLVTAQDPKAADPFMRVQAEINDTKAVLHKTMEDLLQRGERLDELVNRSDALSTQSKMFYKTAKKTNSCC